MRISDWSSDVCSSYLYLVVSLFTSLGRTLRPRHPWALALGPAGAACVRPCHRAPSLGPARRSLFSRARSPWPSTHLRRRRPGYRAPAFASLPTPIADAAGPPEETGRTSCRERVCEYV